MKRKEVLGGLVIGSCAVDSRAHTGCGHEKAGEKPRKGTRKNVERLHEARHTTNCCEAVMRNSLSLCSAANVFY